MEPEKLRTESPIIFKGKEIPKGKILIVGSDVTEPEARMLKSMGKQISIVTEPLSLEGENAGPSAQELEETRKYIESLEGRLAAQEPLTRAANYLGAITDAELVAVLKARKTKIPPDATREQLLELLITQATNAEVPT